MRRRSIGCAGFVLVLVAASVVISGGSPAVSTPPSPTGGFVDAIRFFEQPNQAQAFLDLQSGAMDIYMFPLRTAADIEAAHSNPDLRSADTYGGENNMFANPVPVDQAKAPGVFNPFAVREIREALNYLVDRDYLNQILYGGYATTHATLWNNASPEVARDPFFFLDENLGARYDFGRAKANIFDALNASGATYNGTAWIWQGNPIVVQFIIRVEDVRREIGDYVADQVERLGLTVNRRYLSGAAAFAIVYNGPPDTGQWMLYTEGWATTQLQRWPDAELDFFYCGGEGSAIWSYYTPPAELQDVCQKLLNGQYSTRAERQALIEEGVTLALNNSVRVWLLGGQTQAYSARVTALISDAAAGLWSPLTLRAARFATPGGTLQVGQRLQMLSPWNPWQGFGWVYDRIVANTFTDPALTSQPYTGSYIPVRAGFETTTAGPTGSIDVPVDALTWDSTTMGYKTVGTGVTARSTVNYTFTFGTWHDGSNFTMDDVLYELALVFRRADSAGDVYAKDVDSATASSVFLKDVLRGVQVKAPNQLEVWYDYWHIDPSEIASLINPAFPSTPWTASELALSTVFDDTCRVSEVTAANDGKEALDLTKGACLADMDANLPSYLSHLPPGLNFDPAEAATRWAALQDFRQAYGHFYASDGPFYLESVNATSREATLGSDVAYPFPADRWDELLTPPTPTLAIGSIPDVITGQAAQVNLTTTVNSVPYSNATVLFRIRPEDNTTTLLEGAAVLVGPGEWQVDLDPTFTSILDPGSYRFQGAANGNETSAVAFADRMFNVSSPPPTDTVAPTSAIEALPSYWQPAGPFHLDVTASDDQSGVAVVDLYVAYSADGATWPSPSLAASDGSAPFAFDFGPSSGDGRYRFWTLATDGAGNAETLGGKPATGDLEVGLDSAVPTSQLTGPLGYWQADGPFSLGADASDATSGVARLDLYASYSADGTSWSAPALVASDSAAPFAFSFAPTLGDGRYRFWVVAADAAGNAESLASKPSTGEVEIGLDTVAPTVVSSTPADGATGIPTTGVLIRVTFSEAVDHAEAEAAFTISPSVAGVLFWEGNTLVFAPTTALASGTAYQVTIRAGVTDLAGNTLAEDHPITFTTETIESLPPPLGWVVPVAIALAVIVAIALSAWVYRSRKKR